MRRLSIGALLLVAGWLLLLADAEALPRRVFFQRGVNFTAEWPDAYSSPRAEQMLRSFPAYGINAIALVPYGLARRDEPRIRMIGRRGMERDDSIRGMARVAHAAGLKVMLKPQLWVRRSFPGELDFASEHDRALWFGEYGAFIEHYANLAAEIRADIFCVGVELARLTRHEAQWRDLIRRVRRIYRGPLVYAANWGEEFETLRFWDALDYIGLNQYYPLPDDLSTADLVRRVEAVQRKYRRPVLFTEAGFASLQDAHRKPWDETPRRISLEHQARAYAALLGGFYRKPWFQGVYWWKVGSDGHGGPEDGSLTPWGKPAMEVVTRWYRSGGR
jgi:hypothetical protein